MKYPLLSSDILLFSTSIRSVILANNSCNERDYTIFDFSRFTQVESIEIGNDCFGSVQTFLIEGLNRLKSIKIGNNSFTHKKNRWGTIKIGNNSFTHKKNRWGIEVEKSSVFKEKPIEVEDEDRNRDDQSKSFHILNCESLESIQVGEYSFSDFGGEFELKNLPQLQSIQIGTIGNDSYNFYCSSFVIRGIEMILNIIMNRSSKSTIHYIR